MEVDGSTYVEAGMEVFEVDLGVDGNVWKLMEVFGSKNNFLEVNGGRWKFVEAGLEVDGSRWAISTYFHQRTK